MPGRAQHRVLGDVINSPGPARRFPGRQQVPSSPPPPGQAPPPARAPECVGSPNWTLSPRPESPIRFDGDFDAPTPPPSPGHLVRSPRRADESVDDELPEFEPHAGHDSAFEQYLDSPLGDFDQNEDSDDLMNANFNFERDEDDPHDPDFGLPAGSDDAPPEEGPLFQFPLNEDLESNLDDDPDEEVNQGDRCAAFREPELIRNV
ncbi:hypothetical protein FRC08_008998 [Ceratobasidium sp. 394]|nr:hypothetical protein FRC08_008998 [Ceratobasidium sp. 394]KAG9099283.1 hypothetical protein FS749_001646 [Ceratobasidium sp. UAMH 11750]